MFVNVVLIDEETALSEAMIATAMSEAMRPYSMAVAPDSSEAKRLKMFVMTQDPCSTERKSGAVEDRHVSSGDRNDIALPALQIG